LQRIAEIRKHLGRALPGGRFIDDACDLSRGGQGLYELGVAQGPQRQADLIVVDLMITDDPRPCESRDNRVVLAVWDIRMGCPSRQYEARGKMNALFAHLQGSPWRCASASVWGVCRCQAVRTAQVAGVRTIPW